MNVPSDGAASATAEVHELSLLEGVVPLVHRWRVLLGLPLLAGVFALIASFVVPRDFSAVSTFTAEGQTSTVSGALGGASALASQLGLGGLAGSPATPDFFAQVVSSRELLEATLLTQFHDYSGASDSTQTLLALWNVKAASQPDRLAKGVRRLKRAVSATADKKTGVITLTVQGRPLNLTADIANRLVELLNQFNLERRQSQSRAQRRFAGERLAQSERELKDAEARQLGFLQSNRTYASSPLLAFEASRLERDVQLRQEVYVTITREFEQARIAEVRDTPVLTIIDRAVPPERRDLRYHVTSILSGFALGIVLAVIAIYALSFRDRANDEQRRDYVALKAASTQAWTEVRRLLHGSLKR